MTAPADRPGVVVRPPLLYAAGLIAVLVLRWLWPMPIFGRSGLVWPSLLLVVLGVAIIAWGRRALMGVGTNVDPTLPTTAITTSGPYRFSRNPLYLGVTLMYLGLALPFNTWWSVLVLAPIALVMHRGVVRREERYLEGKFGEPYRQYRLRVRRYLCLLLLLSSSDAFAQLPAAEYRLLRPDGPGPHPAVALLSGCDGLAPARSPALYERRAEHLRGLGHVVVFVDYLGRRGLKTCGPSISHDEAARDLVAATAWLKSQPAVDPSRITAMGWSYGGRAVLVALARNPTRPAGFSRAVVLYPDCRAVEPWKTAMPVLMLLGGDDDMTPPGLCQDAVKRLAEPSAVKIVVYAGARHAFDVPELPAKVKYGFATIGYQPEAAEAARKEVEQFLRNTRGR
jgi:dienelactone hydrolase/protein-S-isoprenylcysteine O-methyltransferase Ste14